MIWNYFTQHRKTTSLGNILFFAGGVAAGNTDYIIAAFFVVSSAVIDIVLGATE